MVENENENQVQEKDVVDKAVEAGVNKGKNFVAKKTKNWIVAHLPIILKAIGIFFLIILALGIINLIPFLIEQTFNKILGIFDPDDPNAEAAANNMDRIVYINKDSGHGEYKLAVTDFAEQILEELENKKVDPEAAEFITEDLEDMIDKYIKAEVQTSYLKTEAFGNEVDGIITVSRLSADAGEGNQTPQKLGYMPYEHFEGKPNDELLPFFSIDPDTFKLWLVVRDSNGNYAKKPFDYMTSIQGYSVPFRFFIILHVFAQDVDFMQDFVKLVLGSGNEAPIELTYVESKSVITTEASYSGTDTTTVSKLPNKGSGGSHQEITVDYPNYSDIAAKAGPVLIDNSNVSAYLTTTPIFNNTQTRYSGKLYVTKADTWIKSSSKEVGKLQTETRPGSEEVNEISGSLGFREELAIDETGNVVIAVTSKEYYIIETITTTITESKYAIVDGESTIKLTEDEGIIKLINDYPKVKDNLTSAPSNLFYLFQQSESTQTLEKIMRYVLYMLSGIDYGVQEDDLDSLLNEIFNSYTGGGYGNSVEAKVWFALRAAGFSAEATAGIMGNIEAESEFNPSLNEEGNGIGYGLCQWSFDRRTQLEDYAASKGVAPSDVETQIEFLIAEMTVEDVEGNGAEEFADFQFTNTSDEQALRNAKTPEEAAEIFCCQFERPNAEVAHLDRRKTSARNYYEYYTGIGDANEMQLVIVDIIKNPDKYEAIEVEANYCLAWTSRVYVAAANSIGEPDPDRYSKYANCASCAGYQYGVSTDFSNIPLGATVYISSTTSGTSDGAKFGHVGIYIGEGEIAHNLNGVSSEQPATRWTVDYWLEYAESIGAEVCWGWQGDPVNENYPISKGLIPTGWGSNNCM